MRQPSQYQNTLVPVLNSGEKGQATATLDGQEIDANHVSTLQTKQPL